MSNKPNNDRDKALAIIKAATGDAPVKVAANFDQRFSQVEIACLAHAHDEGSNDFAREVLSFAETRRTFEALAEKRVANQVANGPMAKELPKAKKEKPEAANSPS